MGTQSRTRTTTYRLQERAQEGKVAQSLRRLHMSTKTQAPNTAVSHLFLETDSPTLARFLLLVLLQWAIPPPGFQRWPEPFLHPLLHRRHHPLSSPPAFPAPLRRRHRCLECTGCTPLRLLQAQVETGDSACAIPGNIERFLLQ